MEGYSIRILQHAEKDLDGLTEAVAVKIVKRIRWLSQHLDVLKPTALRGDLSGLFTLREGDYRIIYQI